MANNLINKDLVNMQEFLAPTQLPNASIYEELKKIVKTSGSTLYVVDDIGRQQETLLEVLGSGGSKRAVQIAKGRALIVPNMDEDPIPYITKWWERAVKEEVAMSKILTQIGLLSPLSEHVHIALSETSEDLIPAYRCETFANLGQKGCFIVDSKNPRSSTWKGFLFNTQVERLDEKNWGFVLSSLVEDVTKMCLHEIPYDIDSLNIAIVKNSSESAPFPYEVRYFGFDFSSKIKPLKIPKIKENPMTLRSVRALPILEGLLEKVFSSEFRGTWEDPREKDYEIIQDLYKSLVGKCRKMVDEKTEQQLYRTLANLRDNNGISTQA